MPSSKGSRTAAPTSSRRRKPTPASSIGDLRIDGGMSANATFVQALADATQRAVEVSPVREATTLGAAFAAGAALGIWTDDDVAATWRPARRVEPQRALDRDRWRRGRRPRAVGWYPELSAIEI